MGGHARLVETEQHRLRLHVLHPEADDVGKAASKMATIKRVVNGKPVLLRANYKKLAQGNDPDVPLQDGDTIYLKENFF